MQPKRWNRRAVGTSLAAASAGATLVALLPGGRAFGDSSNGVLPQATAVSPQATPQPAPPFTVKFYPIDSRFQAYYDRVEGPRVLGGAISPLTTSGGRAAQYFEKARLEDWRDLFPDQPEFQFQYGLLVDEMKAIRSLEPVGGDRSTVTYDTIETESDPSKRVPPPGGFSTGTATLPDGAVFIPFSADLSAAPGHRVPAYFWEYINQGNLFPGGWLHDIGLPITEPLDAVVDKGRIIVSEVVPAPNAGIVIQAFQRTILTYDPNNPAGYLVERANTGTDYVKIFRDRVPQP